MNTEGIVIKWKAKGLQEVKGLEGQLSGKEHLNLSIWVFAHTKNSVSVCHLISSTVAGETKDHWGLMVDSLALLFYLPSCSVALLLLWCAISVYYMNIELCER